MSANFTPTLNGYTGQQPFRFWCQTALPLIYDDSLSYYELLNKMVVYLNNVISDVGNMESNVNALLSAYNQLQEYVNTYFDNLDVQEEINNKLDAMAEGGTLSTLIAPFVADGLPSVVGDQIDAVVASQIDTSVGSQIDESVASQIAAPVATNVTSWLNENVTPVGSAVVVDESLSISGAAADAKVTGDKITDLKSALELQYTDNLYDYTTNVTGSIVVANGELVNTTDTSRKATDFIKVGLDDEIYTNLAQLKGASDIVVFYDSLKRFVSNKIYKNVFTVPDNVSYVRFNITASTTPVDQQVVVVKGKPAKRLVQLTNNIDNELKKSFFYNIAKQNEFLDTINVNKTGSVLTSQTGRFCTGYIPVESGKRLYWNASTVRFITAYDSTYTVNSSAGYDSSTDGALSYYDVPVGISYIIISVIKAALNDTMDLCVSYYPVPYGKISIKPSNIAFNTIVTPEEFGAYGDGTHDDTEAIQAAVDYIGSSGKSLVFSAKTYYITDIINIPYSNFTIRGNNATLKYNNGKTNKTGNNRDAQSEQRVARDFGVLTIHGNESGDRASIVSVSRMKGGSFDNHLYVYVDQNYDMSNFSTGYVRICANGGSNIARVYKAGFNILCRVAGVSGNRVEVDYDTPFDISQVDYSGAYIVPVLPMRNIKIEDITITDNTNIVNKNINQQASNIDAEYMAAGIGLYYCANVNIDNVTGIKGKFPLIMSQYVYNLSISNISSIVPDCFGPGEGYTAQFCGVMIGKAEKIYGKYVRHIVDFSYSAFCQATNINGIVAAGGAGFDLHGIYEHDVSARSLNCSCGFGNGFGSFPGMIENVNISDSSIDSLFLNAYLKNIRFFNSQISTFREIILNDCVFDSCDILLSPHDTMSYIHPQCAIDKDPNVLIFQNCNIRNNSAVYMKWQISLFDRVILCGCEINGMIISPYHDNRFTFEDCKLVNTSVLPVIPFGESLWLTMSDCLDITTEELSDNISELISFNAISGTLKAILSNFIIQHNYDGNIAVFGLTDTMEKVLAIINTMVIENNTEYVISVNNSDTGVKEFVTTNLIES